MSTPGVADGNLRKVLPKVYVGASASALADDVWRMVRQVIVDSHLHLPDMFEITFRDNNYDVLTKAGITIGVPIEVWAGAPSSASAHQLIAGEVTSIEGVFAISENRTVLRGYTADHRLQRIRRSQTFVNMKDSDIARKVASHAGLTVGTVEETKSIHDHVAQVNQTDWEFLTWRARAIGYELGVSAGKFYFRKASGTSGGQPVAVSYPDLLRAFRPRVTAGNLGTETEIRVWDPLAAKVISAKSQTSTGSVDVTGARPAELGGKFPPPVTAPPPAETNPSLGDVGPAPSELGFVVSNWPLAIGSAINSAAGDAMTGVAEQIGSSVAEAEGEAIGDPRLLAGTVLDIAGVPTQFAGTWVVTNARHVLDATGYHTLFTVSGRQERSTFGLASGGASQPRPPLIHGVVCGIVSQLGDPLDKGRVKVTLPWLSPGFESDWACVAQFGAGKRSGAQFLPEVGDEVLVAFEFGDPHRPYVLGGVVNNNSAYQLGGPPVETKGSTSDVVWRGFTSPSGNRLAFHDKLPPGEGSPQASELVLGTRNASLALAIDQVAGTVTLTCKPAKPDSDAAAGHLTIACGDKGTIDINAGDGGTVNVNAGAQLNVTAKSMVKIESSGSVEITGKTIKLN
jgi:phage protein D